MKRERTPEAERYRDTQAELLKVVKEVGESGNIGAILELEKAFLQNERRLYADGPGVKGSLDTALKEVEVAQRHLPLVRDPERYEEVDESHALPRVRRGGLPRDGAHQGLASHNTRLLNVVKVRLTAEEKKIIDARRNNLRTAEKLYEAMQRQALGLPAPAKGRSQEHGLSP